MPLPNPDEILGGKKKNSGLPSPLEILNKPMVDENERRASSAKARADAEKDQRQKDVSRDREQRERQSFEAGARSVSDPAKIDTKKSRKELISEGVAKLKSKPEPSNLPGRDIPIVGTALRNLDSMQQATEPFAKFAQGIYTPGAPVSAINAAYQGTSQLVAKALPKATGLGGRVAREAITEAALGAPLTAGNVLTHNPGVSGEEFAKQTAIGTGVGALTGGAAPVLGRGLSKLFQSRGVPQETVQEVLALPAGQQRGNANRANPPRVIVDADTRPVGLPEPNVLPPTTARMGQAVNPYRQKFETLISEAKRLEADGRLTPGREDEDLRSLWSQMAEPNDPNLDELIDLAYKPRPNRVNPNLVNQARQTQNMRAAAGVPPIVRTMDDRYQPSVTGNAAPPVERVGRAPGTPVRAVEEQVIPSNQPEVINAAVEPNRPRVDVTPEQEVEQIIQTVNNPRVRDRVLNRLDEAEKAARERINARRGRLSSTPVDEWADYAIIGAVKLAKGTIKLADWTEEMVREFGESFRPNAQRAYNAAKEQLRREERIASKQGQEAIAFNDSGVGDASTFDAKISRGPKKKRVPFAQRWEVIRRHLVDDLAPLEGLEKRVRGALASAEDSLYKAARMFRGTPERAAQVVQQRLTPIVEAIEKAGYTSDDLGRYALAKHAKDVNAAGYKSGFTNAEIEDVLAKYNTPEMEAAQQALVKINNDMLQELVNSGVVSKELQAVLNERWKNYVPLFRAFDDEKVEFVGGLSQALANVASPIKALSGSERAVIDPLENMVKNIFQSINAAERNKVASQLAKLAKADPDAKFIRKLDDKEQVGRKNVVNVKVNGENVKYEVETEVYKALLNLDQESSNMLINILSKPASLLRAGATLTPEFSLRNPMRDILQAFVTSNSGFNPITDFLVGLGSSIKKGKLYQDWVDNLGAYGNIISMDRDVHRQALEKVLGEPTGKKWVNIVNGKSLIRLLRAISDTTESATKVGEYRAALRQGQTKQEAAYRSRDIMDFARAGSSVRQTNRIVAFLNANIQGKSKLIRAIKQNPIGTTARMFAAVTVPTIGIYALNRQFANDTQKQTIADAPDWQKDAFWLIAIPGTDQVARIPKPFDIAPIFANLPEKAMHRIIDEDPAAFDGFVQRTMQSSALPVQISGLLPFIEGMADYSFFRQGNIVPQRESGLEKRDQYDPVRTTETAKLLARGAEALTGGQGAFGNFSSPRIMDNTIKGLTAGLGTYATSAIDTVLQGKYFGQQLYPSLVDRPEAPAKRVEQRPLAKAFLVDPLSSTKSMDTFYDNLTKLTSKRNSNRINEKTFGRIGKKDIYLPAEQEAIYGALDDISDAMSDLSKQIRTIESGDLSATEKRRQIEPLLKQRNQLAHDAVKKYNLR